MKSRYMFALRTACRGLCYRMAALLLSVGLLLNAGLNTALAAGNPFRDLIDISGHAASLDNSFGNGKWTLVMIWATDCHICAQQKPEISAFYDKHKNTDANVLGIALDGHDALGEVQRYLDRHQASFPNYVGDYAVVALNYQMLTEERLRGTPTYLLFDPAGELRGNNPGPVSPKAIEQFITRHSE